ncbi:hypothetical protein [Mycobacteroides abscessus]|uniref:hypothetical protein n=1 Tax=Mycobacteroides abscessus TaxID=36809 RepID=UPI00026842FA|nr:hypothetical protein [Mycobacteroides abscessus]EIV24500.1 putative lipoprotein [Mycobacteroides abscessus 3A-0119-R]EIV29636.1 putative lipoprotein [Mycobacteroides abscessus 3A-0122-R]EIV36422.1 putative lipoprotein [Mycobacteroides abscessus 3A-0122-S]EIV38899.1 putative lipoprotein [Mycobacteroides abscessus 3A-0731]EIV53640.1 putative lipoprotein [Mycobacteroides abscessus 3A-0930-S]
MKKNLILAATVASAVVGLAACGSHSTPAAQSVPDVFPIEQGCADVSRPADPHGLIGDNWLTDDACAIFNMNRPGAGVDADQGAKIVYDARMKALMGKRDLALLARQGNAQMDNPAGVITDFKDAITERRAALKQELDASSLALQGRAPQGFRISYLKGEGR